MKVHTYIAGLVSSVSVLCYLNTLDCGLCFDDERAVIQNNDLRPATSWNNLMWNDFWGVPMNSADSHKSYRPLCVATFRLNYLLHELEPMGYHLVNILLHGVVCYLYVQLCSLVFSEVWPALIAGLLFAVHPIHTEAVTGVVGRADIMAALFYISCILVYHKAAQAKNGLKWLFLCLVLCVCSALSKETGLTAVAICIAMDVLFLQQLTVLDTMKLLLVPQGLKNKYRCLLTRLLVMTMFVVGFMYCRLNLMKGSPRFGYALNPALYQPTPYRQLHWSYLSAFHCWLLLVPSALIPEYSLHTIPLIQSIGDIRNLATVVTFLGVALLAAFALSGRGSGAKVTLLGLSLMVFPYLPASNLFFPVGFVVAERVLYLPSMGLCLLVAHGAWKLLNHKHKLLQSLTLLGITALLVVHTTKTVMRNRDWLNDTTLYTAAIKTAPNNAKLAHNLAVEYSKIEGSEARNMAIELLQLSLSAEPLYLSTIADLGYLLYLNDRHREAEKMYRRGVDLTHQTLDGNKTIAADVKNLKLFTRLSKLLRHQKRFDEAELLLLNITAKLHNTVYPSIHVELANVLTELGNTSGALVHIEKALAQDSKRVDAYIAMGKMYMKKGSKGQAESVLREAIQRLGYQSLLVYELAVVLQSGYQDSEVKLKEAETLLRALLQAQPHDANTLHTLGLVYISLKQYNEAHTMLLRAVQESSNHIGALNDLIRLYVRAGNCERGREKLEQLLRVDNDSKEAVHLMSQCRQ